MPAETPTLLSPITDFRLPWIFLAADRCALHPFFERAIVKPRVMAQESRDYVDQASSLADVAVSDNFIARFYAGGLKYFSQLVWAFEFVIVADQNFPREYSVPPGCVPRRWP